MNIVILTKNSGSILGPIANILGYLMNIIFNFIDKLGVPNIGLAIIIFTIVIYLLMTPLTYKQQKFSKLSQKMQPELKAIQDKYKGKKDTDSMTKMNEETQAVYAKYGVSPMGSCLQLLIQMPILFALYRVIYAIPAYVTKVGDTFRIFSEGIINNGDYTYITESSVKSVINAVRMYGKSLTKGIEIADISQINNGLVDVLNKLSTGDFNDIINHYGLTSDNYTKAANLISKYNDFFGLNIGDSPSSIVSTSFSEGKYTLIILALLVPVLSALTQWINTALMPQMNSNDNADNPMAQSMKSMNVMMPLMSAVFCYTLPVGMGVYWIAGAVIRSFQQVAINKIIDRQDFDEIIKKNQAKAKEKAEKRGEIMNAQKLNENATSKKLNAALKKSLAERDEKLAEARALYEKSTAKPGSLAAKANKVKEYNEKNNK